MLPQVRSTSIKSKACSILKGMFGNGPAHPSILSQASKLTLSMMILPCQPSMISTTSLKEGPGSLPGPLRSPHRDMLSGDISSSMQASGWSSRQIRPTGWRRKTLSATMIVKMLTPTNRARQWTPTRPTPSLTNIARSILARELTAWDSPSRSSLLFKPLSASRLLSNHPIGNKS